jgi:hypothetical protein
MQRLKGYIKTIDDNGKLRHTAFMNFRRKIEVQSIFISRVYTYIHTPVHTSLCVHACVYVYTLRIAGVDALDMPHSML